MTLYILIKINLPRNKVVPCSFSISNDSKTEKAHLQIHVHHDVCSRVMKNDEFSYFCRTGVFTIISCGLIYCKQ